MPSRDLNPVLVTVLGVAAVPLDESPVRRRREVTEDCSPLDHRQEPGLDRDRIVTHGVDPVIQGMQPAVSHSSRDSVAR